MSNSARKSAYVFEYRITFLGEDRVGKSTLISQIVNKTFIEKYTPTVSNHISHVVEFEGYLRVCLLTDTAGINDFPAMRKLAILKGNAFVLVYAVDNRKSFEMAKKLVREIKLLKSSDEETRIVLVGNKNDLARVVSFEEGLNYSKSLEEENFISAFVESCAKEKETSEKILNTIFNLYFSPKASLPKDFNKNPSSSLYKFTHRRSFKTLIQRKGYLIKKQISIPESGSDIEELISPEDKPTKRFRNRSKSHPNIKMTGNLDALSPKYSGSRFLANIRRGSLPQKLITPTTHLTRSVSLSSSHFSPSSLSLSSHESDGSIQGIQTNLPILFSESCSLRPKLEQRKSVNEKIGDIIRYFHQIYPVPRR